ncbi:MAG: 4-(cytidine 5'-diphospho)-2-C-methyl-D-erythritol kinase [Planctomycetes bacterium]|nr:4-(cytidine 5'-diphospho)-2-C-methyl-D-erythritol kinase [Planctomycetota bacterium]
MTGGPSAITCFPPAKVNLFLKVLGRRPDGYHEIETLMSAVELRDTLTTCKSSRTTLKTRPEMNLPPEDNLVIKAQQALEKHVSRPLPASFHLTKRIPCGAGLGGGSSDAAAVLHTLNLLYDLRLCRSELARVAAAVGSDVPFFLYSRTAICRGRGEIVIPVRVRNSIPLLIIHPGFGVSTADVYQNLKRRLTKNVQNVNLFLQHEFALDREIAHVICNDLEAAALALSPRLKEVHDALEGFGCPVMMTGSGAAFIVFAKGRIAADIRRRAPALGWRAYTTRTNAGS